MSDTAELKREVKELLIASCKLKNTTPDDIDDDQILFQSGGPLGLDSIDALEFVLALQQKYGVRIDDQNISRLILQSIQTVVDFIGKERKKESA
jgi:acyl carrier protein